MRLLLLCATLFFGCTGDGKPADTGVLGDGDPSNNTPDDSNASTETVQAEVVLLNAMTGAGVSGITVQAPSGETGTTGSDGAAVFEVDAGGTFEFRVNGNGVIDHLLFGPTGDEDFTFPTFVATESLVDSVTASLGTTTAPETGMIVVGIDYEDFSPAVGATASIGSTHDSSWVIGPMGATFGNAIPAGGMGAIIFPSVPPGQVSVTVVPPSGATCAAYPGGGQMPNSPVFMNHVTVVTFHCRN